jgi:hypothetical protein
VPAAFQRESVLTDTPSIEAKRQVLTYRRPPISISSSAIDTGAPFPFFHTERATVPALHWPYCSFICLLVAGHCLSPTGGQISSAHHGFSSSSSVHLISVLGLGGVRRPRKDPNMLRQGARSRKS